MGLERRYLQAAAEPLLAGHRASSAGYSQLKALHLAPRKKAENVTKPFLAAGDDRTPPAGSRRG